MIAPPRTFGTLSLDEAAKTWTLAGIEPHVAIRLKAMFPRIEKTRVGTFFFPNTPEVCADLEWFCHRYPPAMTPEERGPLADGANRFRLRIAMAERILDPSWKPDPLVGFRPGMAPYPFQAQNAALAQAMGRLLIMDDVGLGKTVSALATLTISGALPAAIVVQAHLATQWVKEYIERFTTLKAHIIKGTKPYDLPAADVFVFRYSNIAGWIDIGATGAFKAVVFDEIQELRHGKATSKGQAAAVFAAKAELRLGLSATPIFNYGSEIFRVVDMIEPGSLGTYHDFVREWCGDSRIVKDPDALGTYLREQNLAVRRERAGEPVNVLPIEILYDEDVEAEQEALMARLAMRVVSSPSFTERGQAARELDVMMRMITGMAKAKHAAAYVRLLLEAGEPVLLAGWHRDVYAIWQQELAAFNPVLYTGTESTKQKDAAKAAFVSGETNLMMISLRSGAGLDGLQQRCSTVVFGELDWSPKVHDQVIGRLDRPGQKGKVTAIFLHADGGSDPLIVNMLGLKASQSKGIVDPLSGSSEVHTDVSRIKLLAEDYLARKQSEAA